MRNLLLIGTTFFVSTTAFAGWHVDSAVERMDSLKSDGTVEAVEIKSSKISPSDILRLNGLRIHIDKKYGLIAPKLSYVTDVLKQGFVIYLPDGSTEFLSFGAAEALNN